MTRKEAVELIKQICAYLTAGNPIWREEPIIEACGMAIKALEQQEQNPDKVWEEIKAGRGISRETPEPWRGEEHER